MLSPHERTSLFEALRPPPGAVLDAAVGTSFTLDLEALLTAPIAFALFEERDEQPNTGIEPVGLLESIRRYASRLTLFCQAGQIAVPARQRSVFAWLEDAVIEVTPPRSHRLFHPKVWLARYSEVGTGLRILRMLCATRNLTFDTSWDTVLVLESAQFEAAEGPVLNRQQPLAEFFRTLPRLAANDSVVGADRVAVIESLAYDVERMALLAPEPFEELRFHALGMDTGAVSPFPVRAERAVVISPFLGDTFLADLTQRYPIHTLVSREEAFDRIRPEVLHRAHRLAVLNAAADVGSNKDETSPAGAAQGMGDPGRPWGGLHAKLFVFDVGGRSVVLTGSANATTAGFGGNVEMLVELRGPASAGTSALMADTPGEVGLDDLLVEYRPRDCVAEETPAEVLAARLDELRRAVAAGTFRAYVEQAGDDHLLTLAGKDPLPAIDADELSVTVWPVTLREEQSAQLLRPGEAPNASFNVTVEGLTSFFAVRITAGADGERLTTSFLLNAGLEGAPEDRHSRLLAAMLRDPERLLRYLLLLLADPEPLGGEPAEVAGEGWMGRWTGSTWDELPLLELLLRAVERSPERLDHIDRLLCDLGLERDRILPAGWEAVWGPIWAYRQEARQ
jgi:hypothetical protein